MNGQQLAPMTVGFAIAVVLILVIGFFRRKRNMIAHLAPVKRELKKEKQWLRRGEYNAAMVKGRQNLELFLKLVAEFNGIELDNSAQAMANARSSSDGRGQRETYRMNGRKRQRVMTFQQFGWWLDENGYLDRVGKWELNEIRVIGNKAVHENYVSKEDAWNQYNYMEDLLRIVADRHANRHKKRGPEIKKSQTGHYGTNVRKTYGAQTKARGQNQSQGRGQLKGHSQNQTGRSQSKNGGQGKPERDQAKSGEGKHEHVQTKSNRHGQAQRRENGKQSNTRQSAAKNGQNIRTGGNADRDAKENRKAADQPMSKKVPEERKVKNPQKKESQVEANKLQQSRIVKTEANKPQPGKEVKTETNKRQQNEKAEAAVSIKVQTAGKSEERKPRSIVTVQPVQPVTPAEKTAGKPLPLMPLEKKTEDVQQEKLSSSAKRRQRRKRAQAAREAAGTSGMNRESRETVGTQTKPVRQTESRPARQEGNRTERRPRQAAPATSMRIVTLSQPVSGRTAADQIMNESTRSAVSKADKQPQTETQKTQSENTAKQAARRRRPRRRPAAKTAAGGGDHEE